MSIVRAHWTPQAHNHVIYFNQDGVRGPGFGNDNPAILAELAPLLQVIRVNMGMSDFFISMIPEENYSFGRACIPDYINVPKFIQAFKPIESLLIAQGVQNDCDIEINVETGRGGSIFSSNKPSLDLSIYERVPGEFGNYERRYLRLPVYLDVNGDACKSIMDWYAGAAHGMVSWKWKSTAIKSNTSLVLKNIQN